MTDDEIRIAVAKACGWQDVVANDDGEVIGLPPGFTEDMCPEGADQFVPDYLNDLNAMHEAEKTLIFSKRQHYYPKLQRVCSLGLDTGVFVHISECILATARQRAEAFLRTLGKWKE